MFHRTLRALAGLAIAALTIAGLTLGQTPAVAAELHLLGDDATPTDKLVIGESLSVTALDLDADSTYSLVLYDEQELVWASTSFSTDDRGEAGPILLWGGAVTGCDADADPGYPTRAAANEALADREFLVELYDDVNHFVESAELTLVVGTERTVTWVDESGCPRSRLEDGEELWLEIDNAEPSKLFYVSLISLPALDEMACGEEAIRVGQPRHDARGGSGPTVVTADSSGYLLIRLWAEPTSGNYGLLLSDTPFQPLIRPGDALPLTATTPWKGGGTHGVHVREPCITDFCPG